MYRILTPLLLLYTALLASPGDLDLTFGEATVVTPMHHDISIVDSVIQSDNKLIVAFQDRSDPANYDFGLIRYNTDGSIDTGFGNSGTVITDINNTNNFLSALTLASDGKILTVGRSSADITMVRYNSDGSLDSSFGANGKVVTGLAAYPTPSKVTMQSDGKIVVIGGYNHDFMVLRYLNNGALDPSFGTDGKVFTDILYAKNDYATHIIFDSNDKLVVAGKHDNSNAIAIVRYNTNGSIDTTFGVSGKIYNTLYGSDGFEIRNISIQVPNEILVFGSYKSGYSYDIVKERYDTDDGSGTLLEHKSIATDTGHHMYTYLDILFQSTNKLIALGANGTDDISIGRFDINGDFDPAFGPDGLIGTSFDPQFHAKTFALGADGHILCVGSNGSDIVLARYLSDGQRDKTFGTQRGAVLSPYNIAYNYETIHSIALQSDNKIVVAGTATDTSGEFGAGDIVVERYDTQGYRDHSFGYLGKVAISHSYGKEEGANALAIQNDGKILVGGSFKDGSGNNYHQFLLLRLDINGSLDTTFADNGKAVLPFAKDAIIQDIVLLSNGQIIVIGGGTDSTFSDFTLARYNTDGTLDTYFGTDGKILTDLNTHNDWAYQAQVQNDGKIILAGYSTNPDKSYKKDFALARYSADGVLDTTFGENLDGKVTTTLSSNDNIIYDIALQSDNKIVVAGEVVNDAGHRVIALARYDTNGSIDESFGTLGVVTDDIDTEGYSGARSVAVEADDKILIGNYSYHHGKSLLRYNTNGSKDTSFTSGTTTPYNDILIDTDGKILTAGTKSGDFALQRYQGGASSAPGNSFNAPLIMYLLN